MRITFLALLFLISGLSLYSQKVHTATVQCWANTGWLDSLSDTYYHGEFMGTITQQRWNVSDSAWRNNSMYIYTLNFDSTRQKEVTQIWDSAGTGWINLTMVTYTYTSPHVAASEQHLNWVKGSWQNATLITFTNNKQGLMTKSLKQKWDPAAGVWVNEVQADYTWNSKGKMDHWYSREWDATKHAWSKNKEDLTSFSYDTAWRCLGNSDKIRIKKQWSNNVNSIISYDAQGHKTSMVGQVWDDPSKSWKEVWHEDYTNNADGSVNYLTTTRWSRGGELESKAMVKYTYY